VTVPHTADCERLAAHASETVTGPIRGPRLSPLVVALLARAQTTPQSEGKRKAMRKRTFLRFDDRAEEDGGTEERKEARTWPHSS
jgi:hypothetical protein